MMKTNNVDYVQPSITTALTGEMIQKLLPFKIKIVRYSDIANYDDIDKLLEPFGCVVILFETPTKDKSISGHWTGLCRTVDDDNNPSINFFDSYGKIVDDQKKFIDKKFQQIIGQSENYLTWLLYQSKKLYDDSIEYNEIPFQKMATGINTCGRHVALRLILKDKSMTDFQETMKYLKNTYGKSYDDISVILTNPVLIGEMNSLEFRKVMEDLFMDYKTK